MVDKSRHWMLPRPKRRLVSVPHILQTWLLSAQEIALEDPDDTWSGNRERHIRFEEILESEGIKRPGKRRDASGSGGRTYAAMLKALGLIFTRESDSKAYLTIAGEELINGGSPSQIISTQVMRLQYPSPYSLSIRLSPELKVRPALLVLQLLLDPRVGSLSEEEIGTIVMKHGTSNSSETVEAIVHELLAVRNGNQPSPDEPRVEESSAGPIDFFFSGEAVAWDAEGSVGSARNASTKLLETANVFVNWLDYTQFLGREEGGVWVLDEKRATVHRAVDHFLAEPLLSEPEREETFQRRFGRGPNKTKDTRNLDQQATVTARMVEESLIKAKYLGIAEQRPVNGVDDELVNEISGLTGIAAAQVERFLRREYPHGNYGLFLNEYVQMAYESRNRANDFEVATTEIFRTMLSVEAEHTGISGQRTPDVVVRDGETDRWGLIDNKAYRAYSLGSGDDRAMREYLRNYLEKASAAGAKLDFFLYIAAGFKSGVVSKLNTITEETGVPGSAIDVQAMAQLAKSFAASSATGSDLFDLFQKQGIITLGDVNALLGGR
ncbi:restriction endonuclease FokI C-terminal domain-containing protein [Nesterenkonia cremea]|nr:restriction endonuclease FokI C-terminal domain-containing protein [Nesterenkonia cremea]